MATLDSTLTDVGRRGLRVFASDRLPDREYDRYWRRNGLRERVPRSDAETGDESGAESGDEAGDEAGPGAGDESGDNGAAAGTFVVVDTGQDVCYDELAQAACAAEGSAFYGQDAPARRP